MMAGWNLYNIYGNMKILKTIKSKFTEKLQRRFAESIYNGMTDEQFEEFRAQRRVRAQSRPEWAKDGDWSGWEFVNYTVMRGHYEQPVRARKRIKCMFEDELWLVVAPKNDKFEIFTAGAERTCYALNIYEEFAVDAKIKGEDYIQTTYGPQ